MFENYNVFPEYFFIWVPLFNDVVHKEIDEWLYVMKHSDVREDFKSPYMAKVAQRLSMLKMNDKERNEYFKYLKDVVYSQDVLTAAREEGEAKGKAEGEAIGLAKGRAESEAREFEAKIETAKKLLKRNMPIEDIADITDLDQKAISALKKTN